MCIDCLEWGRCDCGRPVTEASARKRERAAWDAAWDYTTDALRRGVWGAAAGHETTERDRRYPLPTRQRSVTLSSGEKVAAVDSLYRRFGVSDPAYVRLNATSVLTAADIAALAELIAHPTEPCE